MQYLQASAGRLQHDCHVQGTNVHESLLVKSLEPEVPLKAPNPKTLNPKPGKP